MGQIAKRPTSTDKIAELLRHFIVLRSSRGTTKVRNNSELTIFQESALNEKLNNGL